MRGIGRKTAAAAVVGALIGALSPASAAEARSAERLLAPAKECKGQRSSGMPAALQVRAMVCLHRYARREAGRRSVRVSPMLRRSANLKAADLMRCGGVVSHEPCGHDAFERQAQVGYMKGEFGVGENLAAGDGDAGSPRAMMLAWLRSPLHRRALLTPAFDEIGVALVHDPYPDSTSRQVWVAHLGYRH